MQLAATLPTHVLGVLTAAGIVAENPLYRWVLRACCMLLLHAQLACLHWCSARIVFWPMQLLRRLAAVPYPSSNTQHQPCACTAAARRFGELESRWVAADTWNFTLVWHGAQHAHVAAAAHVALVLHGVDTFGHVLLNGRHIAATDNAHRCAQQCVRVCWRACWLCAGG